MARPLVALVFVTAALFAGCGGTEISYTEVESDPAELPIPAQTSANALPTSSENDNVTTGKATPVPDSGATDTGAATVPTDTTATTPTTPVTPATEPVDPATTDDSGGVTPPTTEEPEPVAPTDDTGGATAGDASDQFCADNPGAC